MNIPIVLTPQEIAAYESGLRQIVRVAELPSYRVGEPFWSEYDDSWVVYTGVITVCKLPNPLGEPEDVLTFMYEFAPNCDALGSLTRVGDARLVRLQELNDDEITAWAATDWTWPESVDSDGDPYTLSCRLERDRDTCMDRWDANNPDHPWATNPWVWIAGVERQGGGP